MSTGKHEQPEWIATLGVNGNYITIHRIDLGDGKVLKPVLPYRIRFSDEQDGDGLWRSEDPDLQLIDTGKTVTELAKEVQDTLACVWHVYGHANLDEMTAEAQAFAYCLRQCFKEQEAPVSEPNVPNVDTEPAPSGPISLLLEGVQDAENTLDPDEMLF